MSYEISPLALQYAPWSISKAGTAETCPRQYELKYILKVKETTAPSANTVGSHAHKILELRLGGTDKDAAMATATDKVPLTSNERESLQTMLDNIEWFLKRFDRFCKTNGVTELMLERQWGIARDGTKADFFGADVFFRGVVDLAVITQDKDLIVVDHKSGVAKNIRKGMKFRAQLNSYAVMALANTPGIEGVRGGIHFLQGPEEDRLPFLDYFPIAKIRATLTPWLFEHLNDCAKHVVAPFTALPKMPWPCKWCAYSGLCADYQEMVRAAAL